MNKLIAFLVTVRTSDTTIRIPSIAKSSADAIMNMTDVFGAAAITATPMGGRQ
ncbi:hypothetical protein [Undibacterium sp. Ji22W]|uniref:hypothetical protein n=1 Tax=Undibacterium sp. Ji22W TaxID=3413038 RepID=UPI003BF43C4E